tara:strand:+ start:996 stop:1619 length:624 start_codon:yes stop_codon:yes gene_type:complete
MSSCSKCGAPIKSLDSHNCDYCGALIKNKEGELIEDTVFNSYQEFLENFKQKIKKLESKIGEVDFNFDDDSDDWMQDDDSLNRKIAAEINNLYIPIEQQDISGLAQYLKSRITYSTDLSSQNFMSSFANNPVPSAWIAKSEELSTSIKFADDNGNIIRFAEILDKAIGNGKIAIEKIAEKKGQFNTKFVIGIGVAVSILILLIILVT